MSDSTPERPAPPVIDVNTEAAGQLVLRTRLLVKMGVSFEDPRLQLAVNQLGWWPQVVFDLQPDGAEVRLQEADKVVNFDLTLTTIPEGEELKKRSSALIGWCHQLLGEDWVVNIMNRKKKGGKYKMLAKGERLVPMEAHPPTLADAPFPEAVTQFHRYRTDEKKLPTLKRDDNLDLGPILPTTKR